MPVKFDGKEAIEALDKLQNQGIPDAVKKTLDEAAEFVVGMAKDIVPVDTGRLQQSIEVLEEGDDYVIVGSDVEYAYYVEFGTSKMESQPYLSPALDSITARFPDILVGFLEDELPS